MNPPGTACRKGGIHGQGTGDGRIMGFCGTPAPPMETQPQRGPAAQARPRVPARNSLYPQNRHPLGGFPAGTGLQRHDAVEPAERMAARRRLGPVAPGVVGAAARRGRHRPFAGNRGFGFRARDPRGKKTGPNPVDRAKKGSKHHLAVEAHGTPLSALLTAANRHDVTQLIPLVDAIPPIRGKPGRPLSKPEAVMGDRGYDSDPHRLALAERGITALIARRNTKHGSGLGVFRYVVEQTLALLHQFRRLRVRYDRRDDIHEAFLSLGCSVICWRRLQSKFF